MRSTSATRVVVGESIGGTVGLILAARHHPRVRAVVAINPYDYGAGSGLRRSSLIANVLFGLNNVPVLGATFMRLRSLPVERVVFQGGVERRELVPARTDPRDASGGQPARVLQGIHVPGAALAGMGKGARASTAKIDRPVLLLYGDHDWSREPEREANRQAIPGARLHTVATRGISCRSTHRTELVRTRERVRRIRCRREIETAAGDSGRRSV